MKSGNLMTQFEEWYAQERAHVETLYSNIFTREHLENIADKDFTQLFTQFFYSGGGIQTGGERNITKFVKALNDETSWFRNHILEPFNADFNFKDWFEKKGLAEKKFSGWGPGISTIYLSHLNKNRFSILNNKTLTVASSLLPKRYAAKPSATTFKSYIETHSIQKLFMEIYPNIDNFIKADGFFEFLNRVMTPQRLAEYWNEQDANKISKIIEKMEIEDFINNEGEEPREKLLEDILKLITITEDKIKYEGKRYKRNAVVTEKIKKLRNYTCQFCGTTILKKDGTRYIEACHINPKKHRGPETLTNILILCPNCHKEFDYGLREKEERPAANVYKLLLNGRERMAEFETAAVLSNVPAGD